MPAKLSVVMPTYNRPQLLPRALRFLKAEHNVPIVVADGRPLGAVGSIPDDPPAERSASVSESLSCCGCARACCTIRDGTVIAFAGICFVCRCSGMPTMSIASGVKGRRNWIWSLIAPPQIFNRAEGEATDLGTKTLRWIGDLFYYLYVRPRHLRVVIQAAFGDRDARRIVGRAIKRALPAAWNAHIR
jgi:hypothetical protein